MLDSELLFRANNHEMDAMLEVANAYYHGLNVEPDDGEMFKWYSDIIKLNPDCALALCRLGNCYKFGWGVEENPNKAVELYKQAANLNNIEAHYHLARAYKYGTGAEQDYKLAVKHFLIAVDGKDSDAMVELGDMYKGGIGVEQDDALAVKYYKLSAEAENRRGIFALGYAYLFGEGIEQNKVLANEYLKKSAESEHAPSQFVLAINYIEGEGIEKDVSKGIYWLRKASEQEYPKAKVSLGEFYYKGIGVEINQIKAKELFIEAYQLGDIHALEFQLDLYMQDKKIMEASDWAKQYINELMLPEQSEIYYKFLLVLYLEAHTYMYGVGADHAISGFILLDEYINKYNEAVKNTDAEIVKKFGAWKVDMGRCAYKCTNTSYKPLSRKWLEDAYKCGVYTSCLWLYGFWYEPEEITTTFYNNMVLALNEDLAKEDMHLLLYSLASMNIYGIGTERNFELAYQYAQKSAGMGYEPAQDMLSHFKKNFWGALTYQE